jgi:hypothetical protein
LVCCAPTRSSPTADVGGTAIDIMPEDCVTGRRHQQDDTPPADLPTDVLPTDDRGADRDADDSALLPADDFSAPPRSRGTRRPTPNATPTVGPSSFPSEDLFRFLGVSRDADAQVIRKAHERKLTEVNRLVQSPMPGRVEEGQRSRSLLDQVRLWLLVDPARRQAYVEHLVALQHAKRQETIAGFRTEVQYMLRDLILDPGEEEELLDRHAARFGMSSDEAVAVIERELVATGSKRRADLQREQLDRFARLLAQIEEDREAGNDEIQDIVLAGVEAGLTRDEARRRVDDVVRRSGMRIRSSVTLAPLVGIKDPETQRPPVSLEQMHRAVLADFAAGLRLLKEGRLGFWLEQNQASGAVPEQQADAAERALALRDDDPALTLLALLWSTGHRMLNLRSADESGNRRFSEPVASVEDLLRTCDGYGARLSRVLFSRELETWLHLVPRDDDLATAARELREVPHKSRGRTLAPQQFLWRAGETRLRLGTEVVASVDDFAANDIAGLALEDFRKSLDSGALPRWLRLVAGRPDLLAAIGRARQEPAVLRAQAALHVLGSTRLTVGTAIVRSPADLLRLPGTDWTAAPLAFGGRVRVWLQYAHGWSHHEAAEIEALERHGTGRIVQELLWRCGDRTLRLPRTDDDVVLGVDTPEDLASAYRERYADAVAACHADGRLMSWLIRFHPNEPINSQIRDARDAGSLSVVLAAAAPAPAVNDASVLVPTKSYRDRAPGQLEGTNPTGPSPSTDEGPAGSSSDGAPTTPTSPSSDGSSHHRPSVWPYLLGVGVLYVGLFVCSMIRISPDGPASPVGGRDPTTQRNSPLQPAVPQQNPQQPIAEAQPGPDAPSEAKMAPDRVEASSYLANAREDYSPAQAFDGRLATAWEEGATGDGRGEWIEAAFDSPRHITRILLTAGFYSDDPDHPDRFFLNPHLRRLRVEFDGDPSTALISAADLPEDQKIVVWENIAVRASRVRFVAEDVWPGSRWNDLSISEIEILGYRANDDRTSEHNPPHTNQRTASGNVPVPDDQRGAAADPATGSDRAACTNRCGTACCATGRECCDGVCHRPCPTGDTRDTHCVCRPTCGVSYCEEGATCCDGRCRRPCPRGQFLGPDCSCHVPSPPPMDTQPADVGQPDRVAPVPPLPVPHPAPGPETIRPRCGAGYCLAGQTCCGGRCRPACRSNEVFVEADCECFPRCGNSYCGGGRSCSNGRCYTNCAPTDVFSPVDRLCHPRCGPSYCAPGYRCEYGTRCVIP